MRELKFRAWVEWTEKPRFEYSENNYPDTFWNDYDDGGNVEQYTGLKDKNGKEIYEGDIVEKCFNKAKKLYSSAPVEFKHGRFESGGWSLWKIAHKCEVIGNIHEDPELFGGI